MVNASYLMGDRTSILKEKPQYNIKIQLFLDKYYSRKTKYCNIRTRKGWKMIKVKLYCWNVNGIRAIQKKGALLPVFEGEPDIFCIQETKAKEEQLEDELKNIEGYQAYFVSGERGGYSGVAMYSKYEPLEIKTGFGIEKFDTEGRIMIAEFKPFSLFNIYYPNGKASKERLQYKLDFYDAFLDYIDAVKNKGKNVIVCGDVNTAHKEIDIARPKENEKTSGFLPIEREWMDKFVSHGYVDTFRMFHDEPDQYTWWDYKTRARDRNIGWRIDYFYVNEEAKDRVKDAYILPEFMGSDHCPIGMDMEVEEI
jgi:exodeoxyribonuclease-3